MFAESVNCIPSILLFHEECTVYYKKSLNYNSVVLIKFNKTADMNDNLLLKYIKQYLIRVLNNKPTIFVLDHGSSDKTHVVLDSLCNHNNINMLIFDGWTSLIQPLDIFINISLKAHIRDFTNEVISDNLEKL